MSLRVLGGLAAAGAILVSWGALSQPMASAALASDAGVPVSPRWSTYLGHGGEDDDFGGMTRNDAGEVFITGTFFQPVGDGGTVLPPSAGLLVRRSVVVARFNGDGGLAQWSLFGGEAEDQGTDIELGPDGKLYVAGISNSQGFGDIPFNEGQNGSTSGQDDGFVAQLDPTTLMPNWIFMLGGERPEQLEELAVGPGGVLFVAGSTKTPNFPKDINPPDGSDAGDWEAFVARIAPGVKGGTLDWSHVLRGSNSDFAHAIVLGQGDDVYVTGKSDSPDLLPASGVGAPPWTPAGGYDVFVAKLSAANGQITKSLYLGGNKPDEARALAFKGSTDTLFVGGTTESLFFPRATLFPLQIADTFVMALNTVTLDPKGWTFVQGIDREEGLALAVDPSAGDAGIVYVGGRSNSRDGGFPLRDGFDREFGGEWEGFVARVEVQGAANGSVLWSSWVGGSRDDAVLDLRSDEKGRLFIGGNTRSWDLVPPGVSGYDPDYDGRPDGGNDLFLMMVGPDVEPPVETPDAGSPDAGSPDAGSTDAGTSDAGSPDAGGGTAEPEDKALLGWSCGANATGNGPGVLALGTLVGLALLASRRRPRA